MCIYFQVRFLFLYIIGYTSANFYLVSYEIIRIIGKVFRIRGSIFRMIPNPTQDTWSDKFHLNGLRLSEARIRQLMVDFNESLQLLIATRGITDCFIIAISDQAKNCSRSN
jgi:hypothetical protein